MSKVKETAETVSAVAFAALGALMLVGYLGAAVKTAKIKLAKEVK